jgi:hypothetical protein
MRPSRLLRSGLGQGIVENERGEGELVPFVTPRALQFEEMPHLARQSSVLRAVP